MKSLSHKNVFDILKIIKNLDPNKAHGHDNKTIRIIKICGKSIYKPLALIFRDCINKGVFPDDWKRAHIDPIHKNNERNLLKNYRPISLLPVCSKIFEKIIFDSIFHHITINKLLSPHQSGFWPIKSCANQLS